MAPLKKAWIMPGARHGGAETTLRALLDETRPAADVTLGLFPIRTTPRLRLRGLERVSGLIDSVLGLHCACGLPRSVSQTGDAT